MGIAWEYMNFNLQGYTIEEEKNQQNGKWQTELCFGNNIGNIDAKSAAFLRLAHSRGVST